MEWNYKSKTFRWPGRLKSELLKAACEGSEIKSHNKKRRQLVCEELNIFTVIPFFFREKHVICSERGSRRTYIDFWPLRSFHVTLSRKSCIDDGLGRLTAKNTHLVQSYLPATTFYGGFCRSLSWA